MDEPLTPTMSPEKPKYFDPNYLASRKKVAHEIREFAERQPPPAEQDWGVIWPLVGPELTFEDQAPTAGEEEKKRSAYNQTKRRFETAVIVAKQVTALRVGKPFEEVTTADVERAGPVLYWNGRKEHNEFLKGLIAGGEFERQFNFPAGKIVITPEQKITNTKEQFEDFPEAIVPPGQKVIIVTDLYHLPRAQRYARQFQSKFPSEKSILYPSQPLSVPMRNALQEIKKIFPYSQKGDLPPE